MSRFKKYTRFAKFFKHVYILVYYELLSVQLALVVHL